MSKYYPPQLISKHSEHPVSIYHSTIREHNNFFLRCYLSYPWGLPSILYNGYRVFSGGKERPGRDADTSLPSTAMGKKE